MTYPYCKCDHCLLVHAAQDLRDAAILALADLEQSGLPVYTTMTRLREAIAKSKGADNSGPVGGYR